MASPSQEADDRSAISCTVDDGFDPVIFGHLADIFRADDCDSSSTASTEYFSWDEENLLWEDSEDSDDELEDATPKLCPRCQKIDFSKAWTSPEEGQDDVVIPGGKYVATIDPVPLPPELHHLGFEKCLQYLMDTTTCPLCAIIHSRISAITTANAWRKDIFGIDLTSKIYVFDLWRSHHLSNIDTKDLLLQQELLGVSQDIVLFTIVPVFLLLDCMRYWNRPLRDPLYYMDDLLEGGYLVCHNRGLGSNGYAKRSSDLLKPRKTPSWVDFRLVRSWISHCINEHGGHCHEHGLPAASRKRQDIQWRLFDCETRALVSAAPDHKYVALSYVWERNKEGLASKRIWNFRVGDIIPKGRLSPGVEDAVWVTRALGYRHIWVDKLCIDQTSEEDKREQIAIMGDIFGRAEVTILSPGHDESENMPGVRSSTKSKSRHHRRLRRITIGDFTMLEMPPNGKSELQTSLLRERGWTLQEEMLSPRTLYFLEDQALFVCNTAYAGELFCRASPAIQIPEEYVLKDKDRYYPAFGPSILHTRILMARGFKLPQGTGEEHLYPYGSRKYGCICNTGTQYGLSGVWSLLWDYTGRKLTDHSDTLRSFESCLSLGSTFQHPVHHVLGIALPTALQSVISRNYALASYFTASLCWSFLRRPVPRLAGPSWTWAGWDVCLATEGRKEVGIIDFPHGDNSNIKETPHDLTDSREGTDENPHLSFITFLDNIKFEISNDFVSDWRSSPSPNADPGATTSIPLSEIPEITDKDRSAVKALIFRAPVVPLSARSVTRWTMKSPGFSVAGYDVIWTTIIGLGETIFEILSPLGELFRSERVAFVLMGILQRPLSLDSGMVVEQNLSNSNRLYIMAAEPVESTDASGENQTITYRRVTMLILAAPEDHSLERIRTQCQAEYQEIRMV